MLTIGPTFPAGFVLEPFFFQGQAFVEAIREDVNTLIARFLDAWSLDAASDPSKSPFITFKDVWRSTGWSHLHLNTIEPALREAWWTMVARALTERLAPHGMPDLTQAAILFGIYTFAFAQPVHPDSPILPIKLTIPQLKHLATIHQAFSASPAGIEDVNFVVSQILTAPPDTALFYIIPEALKDYPPLPTSKLISLEADDKSQPIGELAISVKAELEELAVGRRRTTDDLLNPEWSEPVKRARLQYTSNRDELRAVPLASSLLMEAEQKWTTMQQEHNIPAVLGSFGLAGTKGQLADDALVNLRQEGMSDNYLNGLHR